MEREVKCPKCGAVLPPLRPDGTLSCANCGATFRVKGQTCPECGAVNMPDAAKCQSCGRPLNVVDHVIQSRAVSHAERLRQTQEQATALKEEAERASDTRMRQMWDQEEARRRSVAAARAQQHKQERTILTVAIVAVVVIGLVVAAILIVTSGGESIIGATPTPLP